MFIGPKNAQVLAAIATENNPNIEVITISQDVMRNNLEKLIPRETEVNKMYSQLRRISTIMSHY